MNKADQSDEDDYNNDFEDDANNNGSAAKNGGDDQLDKLRRALNKENKKAAIHASENKVISTGSHGAHHASGGLVGPKINLGGATGLAAA